MVGVTGLEPAASWSRTKRTTKLCHTPASPYLHIIPQTERFVNPFFEKKWKLSKKSDWARKDAWRLWDLHIGSVFLLLVLRSFPAKAGGESFTRSCFCGFS